MKKRKSLSAVSIAINNTMSSYQNGLALVEKGTQPEFTIKIANTIEEREAAFRLGYQVYLEKGYIRENPRKQLVQKYDSNSETVIFIVQDQQKNLAGTVTLVVDGVSKIPAEKIYASELNELRSSGCTLTEASRLVVSPDYRNSKEIIILLFNYLLIYIQHVSGCNGLAIQVNPRHKQYYKTLLNLNEIGDEKACPQVQNAPAVLLHLPMSKYQSEIKRFNTTDYAEKKERSLYQYFLKPEQESLVAFYLAKQNKPISDYEKQYFGLVQANLSEAMAV